MEKRTKKEGEQEGKRERCQFNSMKINKVRGENMIAGPSVRRWHRENKEGKQIKYETLKERITNRQSMNLPALLIAVKENLRVALIKGTADQPHSSLFFVLHPLSCLFLQVLTVQSDENNFKFLFFFLLVSVSKLFHFPVLAVRSPVSLLHWQGGGGGRENERERERAEKERERE